MHVQLAVSGFNWLIMEYPLEQGQPRWKTSELLVLIAAKRSEFERSSIFPAKDIIKNGDTRWKILGEFCNGNGVKRTASQCRSRWEKMLTEFKKVYDYQRNTPEGSLGYFEMGTKERKSRKLPLNIDHECYNAMELWFSAHRVINPDPEKMIESPTQDVGQYDNREGQSLLGIPQTVKVDDGNAMERSTLQGGLVEDCSGLGEQPSEDAPRSNTTHATPRMPDTRGWKRKLEEKNDDHLTKMIKKFMETVSQGVEKRDHLESEFIRLEEKKLALEERKHNEHVAQVQQIASDITAALKEVSASLRLLGESMSSAV